MDLGGLGDKANDFAKSQKGEQLSDDALDRGGDAADKASGGKFGDKIEGAEDAADKRIGGA